MSRRDNLIDVALARVVLTLHALYSRIRTALTPRRGARAPSPPPPDTREARTAVHEAGHAVANWASTMTVSVAHARIHAEGGTVESTRYRAFSDDARWCLLVCALAGVAAEGVVYGRFKSGPASDDLTTALRYASEIQTPQPWEDDKDPRRGPALQSAFSAPLPPAVAARLAVAYRMARRIIHAYDHRFYRLISMLLARKTAHTSDLADVLGHRLVVLIAGLRGASFVLPPRRRSA